MSAWWTYAPRDFLLFAPQTYWRLFELHNAALWPLPLIAPLVLAALLLAAWRGWRLCGLAAGLVLALAWVVVAEAFLAARYEPINWAVAGVRPAFWVEGALLAVMAARLHLAAHGPRGGAGAAIVVVAILYPLAAPLAGRPIVQAEVAGLAPDPTAVATLGFALMARLAWAGALLALVPALWLLASGATLLTMRDPVGWLPLGLLAAAGAAVVAGALRRHARPARRADRITGRR